MDSLRPPYDPDYQIKIVKEDGEGERVLASLKIDFDGYPLGRGNMSFREFDIILDTFSGKVPDEVEESSEQEAKKTISKRRVKTKKGVQLELGL